MRWKGKGLDRITSSFHPISLLKLLMAKGRSANLQKGLGPGYPNQHAPRRRGTAAPTPPTPASTPLPLWRLGSSYYPICAKHLYAVQCAAAPLNPSSSSSNKGHQMPPDATTSQRSTIQYIVASQMHLRVAERVTTTAEHLPVTPSRPARQWTAAGSFCMSSDQSQRRHGPMGAREYAIHRADQVENRGEERDARAKNVPSDMEPGLYISG
jgi:hypothetical protein